jgi:hypothetical protein
MLSRALAVALIPFVLLLETADAGASAQRTFVASYGSPANTAFNCSLSKPCRAFGDAIGVTSPKGEVVVLDSAGYGSVTILQSISIIAPSGIYAGVSVITGDGIAIGASNIIVVLRGLTINGQGGANGIDILDSAMVHVESCVISSMNTAGIYQRDGTLEVKDTIVRTSGLGVYVQGPGQATLDHVRLEGNSTGLAAEFNGHVAMQDSVVTRSGNIGVVAAYGADTTQQPSVTITRSLISFNRYGVYLDPGTALPLVRVSDSTISDNTSWGVWSNGYSLFEATRTTIVGNSAGGIHLSSLAYATLDSDYVNAAISVEMVDAGSVVRTRSNNTLVTGYSGPGSIFPVDGL